MISVKIRFHPEAELEFGDAIRWYEHQRKGLGSEFLLCIDEAIEKIIRTPQLFPLVHKNIRRVVVRKFPFAVFYEIKEKVTELVEVWR